MFLVNKISVCCNQRQTWCSLVLKFSEPHRLIHTAPEPAWSRLGQKRSKIWSDKVTWSTGRGGASALWCCAQIKQTLTRWSGFWSFYQLKMIQEQWVWPKDWAGLKPVSSLESCGNNLNFEPFKLLIITFISTAHLSFWAHDSETTVFMFVWIETVVLVLLFWFCSGASCGVNWNTLLQLSSLCSLSVSFPLSRSFPVCYQSRAVFIESFPRCCRINMMEVVSTPASGSPLVISILGTEQIRT